jgi:hypothetical protein
VICYDVLHCSREGRPSTGTRMLRHLMILALRHQLHPQLCCLSILIRTSLISCVVQFAELSIKLIIWRQLVTVPISFKVWSTSVETEQLAAIQLQVQISNLPVEVWYTS